jgi:hypothetical protein
LSIVEKKCAQFTNISAGLSVRKKIAKVSKRTVIKNVNPMRSERRLVSVRLNIRIPQIIKNFMETLTPDERAKIIAKNIEIGSQFNLQFDKGSMKIAHHREPLDQATRRAIEYAVRTNVNSMPTKNRKWFKKHWNGMVYMNIKKLVRAGAYAIPWHRDSHYMQVEAVRYKGFCVGAIYVNKPDMPGGNIRFAKNTTRVGFVPPSGTSVTFYDDEIFHKVIPVQAPPGVEYVPRSAFFFVFGTDEKGPFKMGIREEDVPYRNYEKFYRKVNPVVSAVLNKNISAFTNQNKQIATQVAQGFFKRSNAKYTDAKVLYNNMKKTLGHRIYKNPEIKQIINKPSPLSNANKATLTEFAREYFNRNNATYSNVRARYANLKKIFKGQLGLVQGNTQFVAFAKPVRVRRILPKKAKGASVFRVRVKPLERRRIRL